jgi:hypothetical protein
VTQFESLALSGLMAAVISSGQSTPATQPSQSLPIVEEDYRIYQEHPRIFLNSRRLRLLRRERERASIRWQQLEALLDGKVKMAEPGFSMALYYQAGGKQEYGRRAVEWVLGPEGAKDLRQTAIVFDWCQDLLNAEQRGVLEDRLRRAVAGPVSGGYPGVRDKVLAAVALAGHGKENSEKVLAEMVREWWRKKTAPALRSGRATIAREDLYAFTEILHPLADNLKIDLREDAARHFKELPVMLLLTYYPATFPAAENEYRIPEYQGDGEPDLRVAVLSRAAELSLVAFDTNAQELQFLQGWLINDRFLMRGPLGISYEFLWANPYQPGLSYFLLPMHIHDPLTGRLLIRSSWDEDSVWFSYDKGKVQMFSGGARREMTGRSSKPLKIGNATIIFGEPEMKFEVSAGEEPEVYYVVNLQPETSFDVEVDDWELAEIRTDPGGVLALPFPKQFSAGVRFRRRP